MHQNDITPSCRPKKAIHKHSNKHRKVRSGLQSVFQSQNYQVCDASKRHHTFLQAIKKLSTNIRTNIGRSDQVSKVFFNHRTIRSVMHQNDITPSCRPKKAIPKHSNKHRKVRSGLQSVFQSQNYQVCDASKRHHTFLQAIKKLSTNIRTNIGRSDQVSKVFFNHRTIRSVMHQNDITPSCRPKKAIPKHSNKHRKVRSGLQSVFQSQNYQVCDASKRHHTFLQAIKKAIHKHPNKHRKVRSGLQSVFQSQNYQVCDASKRHHTS